MLLPAPPASCSALSTHKTLTHTAYTLTSAPPPLPQQPHRGSNQNGVAELSSGDCPTEFYARNASPNGAVPRTAEMVAGSRGAPTDVSDRCECRLGEGYMQG